MTYNLGNYRSKKGKIYRRWWWFIYICINKGPYSYLGGVRMVNKLCDAERRELTEAEKILLRHGSLHNPKGIKVVPSLSKTEYFEPCFDCGQKISEEVLGIYPDTIQCMDCIKEG
jgi:hypothetical protein